MIDRFDGLGYPAYRQPWFFPLPMSGQNQRILVGMIVMFAVLALLLWLGLQ
jgi:hypothetical protein